MTESAKKTNWPNLRYLQYVLRHKWYVAHAGRLLGVSGWRLFKHDWSKFLPSEWKPYARFFYGTFRAGAVESFQAAWLKHVNRQDHHWQYWVMPKVEEGIRLKVHEMPEECVREMVADWAGAGRGITGRWELSEWWAKEKDNMLLHPRTRIRVEQLVKQLHCQLW